MHYDFFTNSAYKSLFLKHKRFRLWAPTTQACRTVLKTNAEITGAFCHLKYVPAASNMDQGPRVLEA